MKKMQMWMLLVAIVLGGLFTSCEKEISIDYVNSKKYSNLSLEEFGAKFENSFNIIDAEKYAEKLFEIKNDNNQFVNAELLKLGDPQNDINLILAMKFVENTKFENVLWSKNEEIENQKLMLVNREIAEKEGLVLDKTERGTVYKWTGGAYKSAIFCIPSFKKWPAKYNYVFTGNCSSLYPFDAGYVCKSTLTCPPFPN